MATVGISAVLEASVSDATVIDPVAFEAALNILRSTLLAIPQIDAVEIVVGRVELGP